MSNFTYAVHDCEYLLVRRMLRFSKDVARDERFNFAGLTRLETSDISKSANANKVASIVLENKRSQTFSALLPGATVYNHISNTVIFEDKALFALLLKRSRLPQLATHVFRTVHDFKSWVETTHSSWGSRLWVAKDPSANSGIGIFMLGEKNWKTVVEKFSNTEKKKLGCRNFAVMVQEYVASPLLWRGRKLQFRVFAVVTGGLDVWVYRTCLLQVCNKQFQEDESENYDSERHITNVSFNKRNADLFVEENACDVATRYPAVYKSACEALDDMITHCAAPFLRNQRCVDDFEMFGIDFIADANTGKAYLIECNCPPNNEGSVVTKGSAPEEFHQQLFDDLLRTFAIIPVVLERRPFSELNGKYNKRTPPIGERESGLWEHVAQLNDEQKSNHSSDTIKEAKEQMKKFAVSKQDDLESNISSILARNRLTWLLYQRVAEKQDSREKQNFESLVFSG
eukprot:g6054.t1